MSRKGDARIARTLEKQVKDQQKKVRLVERIKAQMPTRRTVRVRVNPDSIYQMQMDWTTAHADCEGEWSWGPRQWASFDWNNVIAPKLANFKTMKWREIEAAITDGGHRMHHDMAIEIIADECQTRLLELDKLDGDIYRFRLGNLRRLWGFRIVHVFEVLWYDPEHNVYPTDPD